MCVTFPGTVASLKQMWGRAGRRGRGLAVYIAGEDALDQFFCRHPDDFLGRPVEAAILDPGSSEIYAEHLLCAAHEAPLTDAGRRDPRPAMARARQRARGRRPAARARHRVRAQARRRLPGRAGGAAVGVGRQLRPDRRQLGRGAGHDRGRPRLLDRPRGRRLPAPRAAPIRCSSWTSRPAGRCSSRSRRLLHPDQAREHDLHRAPDRAPADQRRSSLSYGSVDLLRGGARLPAQGAAGPRGDRLSDARPADRRVLDQGAVVRARRADRPRRGRSRPRTCSARCMRSSTARSPCCR